MAGPGHKSRNLVVAVLLVVLIATDLFPLMTASVPGPRTFNAPDPSSRAGPVFNDLSSNSTGNPAYYASLSKIIGMGTPSGYPGDLVPLDMNGDGNLELATMTAQGFVEVLAPPNYHVLWRSPQLSGGVHAIAKGDIDGDGLPDLIASDDYGSVFVYTKHNLEDPLAPPLATATIRSGAMVQALTVLDFDRDGRQDILCGSLNDYNLTYLRNTLAVDGKTVVLSQNKSIKLSDPAIFLTSADCLGNGDTEIVAVLNYQDYWMDLVIINGTTLKQMFLTMVGGFFEDLHIADVDADGYLEIVMNYGSRLTIFNATNLNEKHTITTNRDFYGSSLGDFNNDGRLELLLIEYYYNSGSYLALFNCTSYTFISEQFLAKYFINIGFNSGDLDKDGGPPEVAITTTKNLTIMELVPAQGYNFTTVLCSPTLGYDAFGLGSLDWNGDGTTDLVTGSEQGLLSIVDPLNGSVLAQRDFSSVSQGQVIVADTDQDGEPELVTGSLQNITLLNKDLSTQASVFIGYWGSDWTANIPAPLAVGDFDHDGHPEVIVGTDDSTLFLLNGRNLTVKQTVYLYEGEIRSLIAADINGDGFPEIITGDTQGHIELVGSPTLQVISDQFSDYMPYGLSVIDQAPDRWAKLVVGNEKGQVKILDMPSLEPLKVSPDLGWQVWGVAVADIDGDGVQEVLAGTGEGWLYALNSTDLSIEWSADLGEWIGTLNSILVMDLDNDGHLEIALGSDGYDYILRMFLPSEKPDISVGTLPLISNPEDGQVLTVSAPIKVQGPAYKINVSVDFYIEPTGANVTGGQYLGRVSTVHGLGTFTVSVNWTAVAGDWAVLAIADPDDLYSETDKANNRAVLDFKVLAKYTKLEWFAGQGTVLGRYQGMVISDTDGDGVPELLVGASEGFVQSYHVGPGSDKEVSPLAMSDDLGSNPYGLVASDINGDGDTEVVVSNGEGTVYAFHGVGEKLIWKAQLTDGPCYGLAAADLDSDGQVEVVAGCHDSQLYILNGKDGTLKAHVGLLFELYALDIADFGNDGKLDIVVAAQDGTVYILNALTLQTEASFELGEPQIDDLKIGDVDHDGRNEIVYGDRSGKVYIVGSMPNATSTLGWNLTLKANLSTASAVKGVQLVDLAKDTGLELLVASDDGLRAYSSRLGRYELLGNLSVLDSLTGMACGDIDTDGSPEVVVGTLHGNITVFGLNATYQGNETRLSFPVQAALPGLGTGLYGTAYGDLDGDGAPEIILGTESGELRVYDGISKGLKLHQYSMGPSLYGLKVADVNGDGVQDLVTGSGDKQVCAYDYKAGGLSKLWCSDKLGDWTIALDVIDANLDGHKDVIVGAGSKVYLLNGTTGRIMNSTFDMGSHILSLATGEVDGDPWPEVVVGTEEGYMPVLNANNLSLAWGVTLDSWPVGLAVADIDGSGLGTIFAGTNSAVYSISFKDRETQWTVDEGQPVWGLAAGDFQSDGKYELFVGLKDGRAMALNASTGRLLWSSTYLGSRAGWYNSIKLGDMDKDGQQELLVGSSGFVYLYGAGYVTPRPLPNAVLSSITLQDPQLADSQATNITAVVYDHSLAPMVNLTVHFFVDDIFADSEVIPYMLPLGTVTVTFPYTAHAGAHNLTVVADRYNAIHEYNENDNELTVQVIVLGAMNLGILGGTKGVRFSSEPIDGVELTVYADIKNTGEEAAGATVKFYWANLRLFGEDTVYVKGQETVVAAVNWTPSGSGDQDVTVVLEPDGFDSNKDDNVATRTLHVLSHPSVGLGPLKLSTEMVEGYEYLLPVNITNSGEAQTTGSVVLYIDTNLSWSSGPLILMSGTTQVLARFNTTFGRHDVKVVLKDLALDTNINDNELDLNVTVRTRPDLSFETILSPKEDQLVIGRTLNIALLVTNSGGSNATCMIKVFDNAGIIFESALTVPAGSTRTLQVPWKVTSGDHNFIFRINDSVPLELNTNNNQVRLSLFVATSSSSAESLWPQASILVVVVLAPVVAALFYYAKVQPVRDAAKAARETQERQLRAKKPVKKTKKGA